MLRAIEQELPQIEALCRRFGVRRLELFGSASDGVFDPATSDLDFLVEIEPPPGISYSDAYFGFRDEMALRFRSPVDLVAVRSLRNRFFIERIAPARRLLYAA